MLPAMAGDASPPASTGVTGPASHGAPAPSQGPARIGRFVLVRKIGEGGMGRVYLAHDEALDRRVAVKVLHRGASKAGWLLREAQALAKLSHPNVVPVYEVGEQDGRVFLAMEYVSGRTLRGVLADPPSPYELLRVLVQAGRGLQAAHLAGLVHRDFKPDNVLIGRDGRARVVDFGIAALDDARESGGVEPVPPSLVAGAPISGSPSALSSKMTETGAMMGTPAFMSPEQFHGHKATAKSDQFSFCVVLYTAVYGMAPFSGDDVLELGQAVTKGLLQRPHEGTDAPKWLWPLIERGLSPDPAERFSTMGMLLDEIEARLPRDADADPRTTQRERRAAFGMLLMHGVVTTAYLAWQGRRAMATPWHLVGLGVSFFLVSLLTVGLLWRGLQKSVHGRQLAGLIVCTAGILVVHRLVAAKLGSPVENVLVIDVLLVASVFAVGAVLLDRRLAWVCAAGLAATAVAAWSPEIAHFVFAVVVLAGVMGGIYVSSEAD